MAELAKVMIFDKQQQVILAFQMYSSFQNVLLVS